MARIMSEFKKQIATLVASAFGFVAALQWNEAIKEWLKPIITTGSGAIALTASAVIVTGISVVMILMLSKINN